MRSNTRKKHNQLAVSGSLLLFFVVLNLYSQDSNRVDLFRHPGQQWSSWTANERENFVYGYVQGYEHGMNEACLAADDLFDKDKPRVIGHDTVPSTFPSDRCREAVAQYSKVKVDLSKGPDFSPYTTVITEFYTKHPEYRDTPFTLLMESLRGAKILTADDIYRKWTTRETAPPK